MVARTGSRKQRRWKNLTDEEVRSIVCHLFVAGRNADQIAEHMRNIYGETAFKRQTSFPILRAAGMQGMFSFAVRNGREPTLEQRIRERVSGLKTLEVIESALALDVAEYAAAAVVRWIEEKAKTGVASIRIGLMGGSTIMIVSRIVARMLAAMPADTKAAWPEVTLQALVVGDNVREPLEDPAAFFTYFADAAINPLRRKYVSLHAPVLLDGVLARHYADSHEFQELRDEARACDIVLISAGAFDDPHSFLGALRESAPATWAQLTAAGCKGDLGRLPIAADGPMSFDLFHPCTLVEAKDLQRMVSEGKRVMLVAAPCGDCAAHKSSIIQVLLELRGKGHSLFSDLVCDSGSARKMSLLTRPAPW